MTGAVLLVARVVRDAPSAPWIMGKATGMNPAILFLSLSIWGSLLGVFGLLIAIAATLLLWSYYKRFLAKRAYESDNPVLAALSKGE